MRGMPSAMLRGCRLWTHRQGGAHALNSLGAAEHAAPARGLRREGLALSDNGLRAPAGAFVLSSRSVVTLCSSTAVGPVLTLTGSGGTR